MQQLDSSDELARRSAVAAASVESLVAATSSSDELLGEGGFGRVALVQLPAAAAAPGAGSISEGGSFPVVVKRVRINDGYMDAVLCERAAYQRLQAAGGSARVPELLRFELVGGGDHDNKEALFVFAPVSLHTGDTRVAAHARMDAGFGFALPRPLVAAVLRDVGGALFDLHACGLVHGDVKPDNIVLAMRAEHGCEDGGCSEEEGGGAAPPAAWLVDLGSAMPLGVRLPCPAGGSPIYMAPEPAALMKLGARADGGGLDPEGFACDPGHDFYSLALTAVQLLASEACNANDGLRAVSTARHAAAFARRVIAAGGSAGDRRSALAQLRRSVAVGTVLHGKRDKALASLIAELLLLGVPSASGGTSDSASSAGEAAAAPPPPAAMTRERFLALLDAAEAEAAANAA